MHHICFVTVVLKLWYGFFWWYSGPLAIEWSFFFFSCFLGLDTKFTHGFVQFRSIQVLLRAKSWFYHDLGLVVLKIKCFMKWVLVWKYENHCSTFSDYIGWISFWSEHRVYKTILPPFCQISITSPYLKKTLHANPIWACMWFPWQNLTFTQNSLNPLLLFHKISTSPPDLTGGTGSWVFHV